MPTGSAIQEPRRMLLAAADRVLDRDGPAGLTSRAVTAEAGVAKGVLHRHFADFDDFLAELVLDRIARLDGQRERFASLVGSGTVTDNLSRGLTDLLDPVAVAVVGLIIFHDGLRHRLRELRPAGIPLITDCVLIVADHLRAEQSIGRLPADLDAERTAQALIGAAHLAFADRSGPRPDPGAVTAIVRSILP